MSPKELKKAAEKAALFLHTEAVDILATEGQKHFANSFQSGVEGFTDKQLKKWPDLKESTKKQKRRKNGSLPPILTNSGHLGDSINYNQDYNKQAVVFSSPGYGQIHNEGGTISGTQHVKSHTRTVNANTQHVKSHTRTVNFSIPQREFMGESEVLDNTVIDLIEKHLDSIFK